MIGKEVRFSRAEVKAARKEMKESSTYVSSVCRDGVCIGLTQNRRGAKYVSAYVSGYWMGDLIESPDGQQFSYYHDALRWTDFLAAVGTEFENDGRRLISLFSKYDMGNNDDYSELLGIALRAFERNLVDAGLLA